jgi:hypothetical protein
MPTPDFVNALFTGAGVLLTIFVNYFISKGKGRSDRIRELEETLNKRHEEAIAKNAILDGKVEQLLEANNRLVSRVAKLEAQVQVQASELAEYHACTLNTCPFRNFATQP